MKRRLAVAAAIGAAALAAVPAALADRDPYPHAFHNNMGYCAPYLAQQRLPDGSPVRPWINHLIQGLTAGDASFEGQKNLGDFYRDKAQSVDDQQCLQRQAP